MSDKNKYFRFELDRKLNPCLKFEAISRHGYQTANRKDHSLSPIFLIYSIFSNRNQMSLFLRKAYDKLITMTGKKGGVPVLVGEL